MRAGAARFVLSAAPGCLPSFVRSFIIIIIVIVVSSERDALSRSKLQPIARERMPPPPPMRHHQRPGAPLLRRLPSALFLGAVGLLCLASYLHARRGASPLTAAAPGGGGTQVSW